jgi:hypothetical protein
MSIMRIVGLPSTLPPRACLSKFSAVRILLAPIDVEADSAFADGVISALELATRVGDQPVVV